MALPRVYTVDEVAEQLQICSKTVLKLVKSGSLERLPHLRGVRITEDTLRRYLEGGRQHGDDHG